MSSSLKSVVPILLIVVGFYEAKAQGKLADSLHQVLTQNITDTTRVKVLLELSRFYAEVNADSALRNANEARKIVELNELNRYLPSVLRNIAVIKVVQGDYLTATFYLHQAISKCNADSSRYLRREKAFAYNLLGVIVDYQSDYDSALFYYFKSLNQFKSLNDQLGVMDRYNNIAVAYQHLSNYPLALKYLLLGLENAPDNKSTARLVQNLGEIYLEMNERTKAKEALLKALRLYNYDEDEPDNTGEAYVNEKLGILYSSAGKADSAVYHFTNALRINVKAQHKNGIAQDYYYFGIHYKNNNQWLEVVKAAKLAIDIHLQGGEKFGIAESTLLLAEGQYKLNRFDEALNNALQGITLSKEIGAKQLQKGYLELLVDISASKQNFSKGLDYSRQLNLLKDSINNEEKIKQVANMEALYENDQKEKELALVRAQKLAADTQLDAEETKGTLLIVGLGLVTLMLLLGTFSYLALKRNRKILELKNEELKKLNQTKDRFFAIVGHDLRGPITSFSGINDLLNWYISKNDMEKVKTFGVKITQSVRQLDTLLNNLLNWAMSQTNAVPYRPEPLQLNQLVKECYGYFQHSLEVKQVELTDETVDDLFVFADKNALSSVFRNLLSNAIKFSNAGKNIYLEVRRQKNRVKIVIQDEGPGISADEQQMLFRKFQTLSAKPTAGERSTGLGLSIVKAIVERHGGNISVSSRHGEGTEFVVRIPA